MEALHSNLRYPAVSGKFYPSDSKQLEEEVKVYLRNSESKQLQNISGLISPHAGYIFSGRTAAAAFVQLNPESIFENIFFIGSSHYQPNSF
jgi:AmmeMemoRadiSam system protein B